MRTASTILLSVWVAVACCRAWGDEQIRQVQEELRKRNLYFGEVDGRATPETTSAVLRFQQRKGFTANGALTNETLRALDLPASAPNTAATDGLPDEPVLRSDVARQVSASDREFLEKLASGDLPAVAEPPSPPPPATTVEPTTPVAPETIPPENVRRPASRSYGSTTPAGPHPAAATPAPRLAEPDAPRLREFVERYLTACTQEQPTAELTFYGPRVDYFDHGWVDYTFISRDVKKYYERWPKRQYQLLEFQAKKARENVWEVTFKVAFQYEGEKGRHASGRTLETFQVRDLPEGWKFVSMKEQRLR